MQYKHWPILFKSLAGTVVLGLVAAGSIVYATNQMKTIDSSYSLAIDGPVAGTGYLTRASRFIADYRSGLFQSLTTNNLEEVTLAKKAIATADAGFHENMNLAMKVHPEQAGSYQAIVDRFNKVSVDGGVCGTTRMLGLQAITPEDNSRVTQGHMLPKCSPELNELTESLVNAVTEGIKANKTKNDALSAITNSTIGLTFFVVFAALAIILSASLWLAISGLSNPVKALANLMDTMAKGNLDVDVKGQDRRDEVGQVARATESFRISLLETEQLRKDAEILKQKAEADRRAAMIRLADDFEKSVGHIVGQVSSAATEMQAAATQLSATAQQTSGQSTAVSAAAEEAGANVTSVASAAEELGSSVAEIGRQVESSATTAQSAVVEAEAASKIVTELNEVAASIGGVVDLIAGLAGQTNLLALNATIESARAGEAGKGFAVVASEVKALAAQTAKATTDISVKIGQIQGATTRAAEVMQSITGTIQTIDATTTAIAAAVEQQTAATQEIVQAVSQASLGTQEVTSNMVGVAGAAEQTGQAAEQVLASSSELATQAERLHHEMDKFLVTVRAA